MSTSVPQVLIIELGSQYTLLIARALREIGYRSVILDPVKAEVWMQEFPPNAVILSGGASSVYDRTAPQPPLSILHLIREDGMQVPVLGICYGMQWLAYHLGGEVKAKQDQREYGPSTIFVDTVEPCFSKTPQKQGVWMSHGDSVTRVPTGFDIIAKSYIGTIAAMRRGMFWGVQFHPEVTHTPFGKVFLQNFMEASLCKKDWFPPTLVTSLHDDIRASVGTRRAIAGFSGGVDSTVMAALAGPVLGKNFRVVLIDGGQLREGEREQAAVHARIVGVELLTIDAANIFVPAISREIDAEAKRRIFKHLYTDCLIKAATDFDAEVVFQGTLAPDRIESGSTGGVIIKSHHNVGLNMGNLRKAHPLESLFKYEVRALAKEMGLPESVWKRHPFPGPGLFARVVGVPVSHDTLALVRWADARVREVLKRHGMYEQLAQVVVGYIGANTVGVAGDGRVYGGAVVVRAVETTDFMTAHGVWLPSEVVKDIKKVFSQYHGIVRVWFDPTDKPPATIEFE